ncbi:MAG TPA: thioredoxin domain-containing protein [Desulfobulbaceae bacterium]|nr:thioredoxin domain-containing protein [Desulfobulbaceae bacterium]
MEHKTNRLAREKSPYLLQHADNPVDWFPWSDEAFALARQTDRPIFLSIGYSSCHWCHVMARESFASPETAALLNRWFVCIKVDREERPDIDQVYMAATLAMTGSGGWPMSVFLFPDGRPFYAGTYFPPRGGYGRPAFADLLVAIHQAWIGKRADLTDVAAQLVAQLAASSTTGKGTAIEEGIMARAFLEFERDFDPVYGGFSQAPKFPRPVQFNFLLRSWHATGNERAREMVLATLRHMAAGGIRDHLGGGFHRYAVDRQWRVPHFEKMLYDQAQLASSYLDAYLLTGDRQFADMAGEICGYVLRDLRDPAGGFYSAEDADSDDPYSPGGHGEGAFYLWTGEEIDRILPAADAELFKYCYGILAGGNAPDDPQGEFQGRNILYVAHSQEEAARQFQRSVSEVEISLERSRALLLQTRSSRIRPQTDDKVITAWNGMMIGALARAGSILEDRKLLAAAERAALFLKAHLYDEGQQVLRRRYRAGESGLPGQLDDYAALVAGLLELYQAGQNPAWLRWAIELTGTQIRLFHDQEQGGFFDGAGDAVLPVRMKGGYDGAEPAGNSLAAMNLHLLGTLTANEKWIELSRTTVAAFASSLNGQPQALPQMLCAWQQMQAKPRQVVIAGSPGREDTTNLLATVFSQYDPGRLVLLAESGENQELLATYLPFLGQMGMLDGKATAYVCLDFACQMPVHDPESLRGQLTPTANKQD